MREKRHCTPTQASKSLNALTIKLRKEIGRIVKNELISRGDDSTELDVEDMYFFANCYVRENTNTYNRGPLKKIKYCKCDDYAFFTAYHLGACKDTTIVILSADELIQLLTQLEEKFGKKKNKKTN